MAGTDHEPLRCKDARAKTDPTLSAGSYRKAALGTLLRCHARLSPSGHSKNAAFWADGKRGARPSLPKVKYVARTSHPAGGFRFRPVRYTFRQSGRKLVCSLQHARAVIPAGDPLDGTSPGVRHVSLLPEAPVPSHAITVMTGVPMEGTAGDYRRGGKGVNRFFSYPTRSNGFSAVFPAACRAAGKCKAESRDDEMGRSLP